MNIKKLINELKDANIEASGCSEIGIIWDLENNEIQDRPDVAAVIAAHDPNAPDYIAIRSDTAYQGFMDSVAFADWTAEELATWVQANVNDLASAKATLVKMAWAIGKLADRAFPRRRGQQPD